MHPWRLMIDSNLTNSLVIHFQEQELLFALGQGCGAAASHAGGGAETTKCWWAPMVTSLLGLSQSTTGISPLSTWRDTLTSHVTTSKWRSMPPIGTAPYSPSHPWESICSLLWLMALQLAGKPKLPHSLCYWPQVTPAKGTHSNGTS